MNEQTDEALMKEYCNGDRRSFRLLYERYEKRLLGFLNRRLSGSKQDFVTDLFQITWLKVHQSRSRFDERQTFSTWFFTIALNALRDHAREARWHHEFSTDESLESYNLVVDPHEKNDRLEQIQNLERILPELSVRQRDILLLSDWEGFTSKEVSEITKISDESVRQILSRTRSQVRKLLLKLSSQ